MIMYKSLVVLFSAALVNSFSPYCYWNTGCKYKNFSSKTAYDLVRGDLRDSIYRIKGCSPVSIWSILRHGGRYPSENYGHQMIDAVQIKYAVAKSHSNRNSSLCAQDVENLVNWNMEDITSSFYKLTKDGYEEAVSIAKRLRETYPEVLSSLTENSYKIRPAYGDYIKSSANGFVEGLGNENSKLKIDGYSDGFDTISPHAKCGKYLQDVRKNPKTFDQAFLYQKSPEYLAMRDRIQRRTGIPYTLTQENITAIYDLCRYFTTKDVFSPWCALLTTEDLKILEYESDLRHFYRNGYGHPWNIKLGAVPLAELYKSFEEAKNGNGLKLSAYLSHSTVLDMIYAALGLFQDPEPLTATKRNNERKWKSSESSTFSSNLIAVLNRCAGENKTDYNVVFYLNEKPLTDICKDIACTWEQFQAKFESFKDNKIDFCEYDTPLTLM